MSEQYVESSSEPAVSKEWQKHLDLFAELSELEKSRADRTTLEAKHDEINRNVGEMVLNGEISTSVAESASAGFNPYFDHGQGLEEDFEEEW